MDRARVVQLPEMQIRTDSKQQHYPYHWQTNIHWRALLEIMPNTQMPTTKEGTSSVARQTEAAFLAVSGERSTARQCRGCGQCPSRTVAGDSNADSKLQQHPFPLEKKHPPHNFSMAPVSMTGFHTIMPITQSLPQRNELRTQPDRRRQAAWAVPRGRNTAS